MLREGEALAFPPLARRVTPDFAAETVVHGARDPEKRRATYVRAPRKPKACLRPGSYRRDARKDAHRAGLIRLSLGGALIMDLRRRQINSA